MAVKTTQASLEEVQTAITKVLSAQSYTIGDAQIARATLASLTRREEWLLARYEKETGTRPATAQALFGDAGDF